VIAPQLTGRTSGHVRVERTRLRLGDGAQMATIAFVDEIKETAKTATPVVKPVATPAAKKPVAKKPAAKPAAKEKK
jgi:hypothetical protein